ncbi:D-aminoacyl-tRNA deacylase-like, partial [Rhodamnia argentea]|uniref:D-aminoacyl-tRNA deacylase-like n=1 Tax=Rhodamnia argentea TaxID=178133 RepID=A0ABM3HGD6_9MYRT
MRAAVQRVASASVEVEGRIVSEIGPGLLVLVGIRHRLQCRLYMSEGLEHDEIVHERKYRERVGPKCNAEELWGSFSQSIYML